MATLIVWKNRNNNVNIIRSNTSTIYHFSNDTYSQTYITNSKNKYVKNIQIKDLNILVGCSGTLLDSENISNVVTEAFSNIIKTHVDYNEQKVIQNYIVPNLSKTYYSKEHVRVFNDFNVVMCINNSNVYSISFTQKGIIINHIDNDDFHIIGNNDIEGYHSFLSIRELNNKLGESIYNKYIKQICEVLNNLNELSGNSWFGYVDHEMIDNFYSK